MDRQDRKSIGAGVLLFFGFLILIAIIAVAIWGFRVVTAPAKGQGDAAIQKYSAQNWVDAQAKFEEIYADIEATDLKIQAAAAAPESDTSADNLQGLKSYCLSRVAEYNADSRKYLSEDFKSADLPTRIDPTEHCKESN